MPISRAVRRYAPADQTITTAGLLTLPHGFGAVPEFVTTYLVCLTAEFNYSIGDVVDMTAVIPTDQIPGAGNAGGATVYVDATNIYIRYSARTKVFTICNKTTGAVAELTNANWALRVRARAND